MERPLPRPAAALPVAAHQAALLESSGDCLWSVDLDFRLVTFNGAVVEGYAASFGATLVEGERLEDQLPPQMADEWRRLYQRALVEGPFRFEFTFPNGHTLDLTLRPIEVGGQPAGIAVIGKDISERKAAESALKAAEKKYRSMFDGALEGMFYTSPDGKSMIGNCALARMLGYESPLELSEAVRRAPQDLWADAGDRARYLSLLEERGAVLGFECQVRRRDGKPIWVSLSARKVCGSGGEGDTLEGFVQDIGARKSSARQLAESEERYRATFEQAPVGILHTSFDGRCLRCNARFAAMIGYPLEEVPGLTIGQITPPEQLGHGESALAALAAGAIASATFEKRYIRKDASSIWVRLTVSIQRDSEGRGLHNIALVEDITERKQAEMQLRESEERFRATFEQAAVGMVHCSLEGGLLRCNHRFAEMLGYSTEEVCRLTFADITAQADLSESAELVRRMAAGSVPRASIEKRYVRKDGSVTWGRTTLSIQRDSQGQPVHYIVLVEDINDRKHAEERLEGMQQALRSSEERYRTAFHTSQDAIKINRLSDGVYIECNPAFLQLSGYEREEVLGHTCADLGLWGDARDRQRLIDVLRQKSNCRDFEAQFRRKNGDFFWGRISASLIEIDGTPCVLAVIRDLSEARQAEDQIRSLSFYDPLTLLPNRRLLLERIRQVQPGAGRARSLRALLFVDLDNFKTLNDSQGHEIGDLLLREVAMRLAGCSRDGDTVARMGGDEFVVMMEGLSGVAEEAAAQAGAEAERILAVLARPYRLDGREFLSTCSIGITVFGDAPERGDRILQQGDIAMYQAKAAGRGTARFFAPALQSAVNARVALEEDIRTALRQQQFLLHFQPQVRTGAFVGAEVLVRWQHPVRGMLMPGEFIPIAEETGLILPLGAWVLESACRQIAAWANRPALADLCLAVNISALQLRQPDFVSSVLATLNRTGADPRKLKLELTESMLVENFDEMIAKMTELNSHGLSFSLDDFGTGYSSLSYLKRLPLSQLKVDRSFVRDILSDVSSGAIAQTIVALGRAMGLSVIAEGVETAEQRDFLTRLGCNSFQGYLFGRPLPLALFESQLTAQHLAAAAEPDRPAARTPGMMSEQRQAGEAPAQNPASRDSIDAGVALA